MLSRGLGRMRKQFGRLVLAVALSFACSWFVVSGASAATSTSSGDRVEPRTTATRGWYLPSSWVARRARQRANGLYTYLEERRGVYVACLRYSPVKVRCRVRLETFMPWGSTCLDPTAGAYITRRFTERSIVDRRTGAWTTLPSNFGSSNRYVDCPSWAQR